MNRQVILGEKGGLFIEDTAANTGNWNAIQCLEDSTFTTLTAVGDDAASGTVGNIAFAAGTIIFGHFTAITLATGAVRAYKASA